MRIPEVRYTRWALGAVILVALLALPAWLSQSKLSLASVIVVFGIVGISLVVLTGWAGQVSLGQMAFVGIGSAVGGALTANQGMDIGIALLVGGIVGALVAVIVGYPAIRRGGLTLPVVTLAFALLTSSYLLNVEFFDSWLPVGRISARTSSGSSTSARTPATTTSASSGSRSCTSPPAASASAAPDAR